MIGIVDVKYDDQNATAFAVCGLIEKWTDDKLAHVYTSTSHNIHPYVPGQLYLRELPPIKDVLRCVVEHDLSIDVLVIDGYCVLNDGHPGLGYYAHRDLNIPIISVAKTHYANTEAELVYRNSKNPLYITSSGMLVTEAAKLIQQMHGPFRLPTVIKQVDTITKTGVL